MSFILDALRKSEHERQRQTGPALAEIAVAPVKQRTNTWATAAIVLLVVNLLAVGTLLLNRSRREASQPPTASASSPQSTAATPEDSLQAPVTQSEPVPGRAPPPMLQPAQEPEAAAGGSRNPLAEEVSGGGPMLDPQLAADASAVPEGPPAVTAAPTRGGTVVYESLPDSGTLGGAAPEAAPVTPASSAPPRSLPTADELTASGAVPALGLQLHVYSNRPQERFVFINGHKYREGDALQEGPVVQQITSEGVVLDLRGSRFLLPRD